jgi:hypothetical protein
MKYERKAVAQRQKRTVGIDTPNGGQIEKVATAEPSRNKNFKKLLTN